MMIFTPIIKDIAIPQWNGQKILENSASLLKVEVELSDGNPGTTIYSFYVANKYWVECFRPKYTSLCSPLWLPDRGHLLMDPLDTDQIFSIVEGIVAENSPCRSFRDLAEKTRRFLFWEMDGMPLPSEIQ